MTPIQRAVEIAGGQTSLARRIDTSASFVHQLVTGRRPVPGRLCIPIEVAVDGKVKREELRPDIFCSESA